MIRKCKEREYLGLVNLYHMGTWDLTLYTRGLAARL
jgi:hypothetical protein